MDDNEHDVKCNIEELETLLEKYGQILHPQHYLMVAMKRYLLYGYSNTDPDLLTKKLAYAQGLFLNNILRNFVTFMATLISD